MRPLFNVHTHRPLPQGEESIRCCGLHPWHVTEDFGRELTLLFDPFHCHANNAPLLIQAIGECGLDRLCQTPYDLQLRAFRAQIAESEKHRLPMIVHCVKAIDDIIALHADATQAWIIHGFRGKPQQLSQLISQRVHPIDSSSRPTMWRHPSARSMSRLPPHAAPTSTHSSPSSGQTPRPSSPTSKVEDTIVMPAIRGCSLRSYPRFSKYGASLRAERLSGDRVAVLLVV